MTRTATAETINILLVVQTNNARPAWREEKEEAIRKITPRPAPCLFVSRPRRTGRAMLGRLGRLGRGLICIISDRGVYA